MRSSTVVVAGLAAVAYADPMTVTHTEDVTVTYCNPSVTNCQATWAQWETYSTTADPSWTTWDPEKPKQTGWENEPEVADPSSTWKSWDGKGPKPTGAYHGKPEEWKTIPDPEAPWKTWDGKGPKPTGAYPDWENMPEDEAPWKTWDGKSPKPTGVYPDWANLPEDEAVWKTWTPDPEEWKTMPDSEAPWKTWDGKGPKPTGVYPASWADVSASDPVWKTWTETAPEPTSTWASWESVSVSAGCPMYTATAPPEWFKNLPAEAMSSMAAKWTGAPPADWCYYSYSTVTAMKTSTVPAGESWVNTNVKATATGPNIAQWTGAANANAGSVAMAGLAGLAALMMA